MAFSPVNCVKTAQIFYLGILLIIACQFPVANAGELSLLINGKAIHVGADPDKHYNEKNWGAGLQYDFGVQEDRWRSFVTMSGFLDSKENPSYYAGGGVVRHFNILPDFHQLHFDAGLVGFFMTREDYLDGDWFPGILPFLSLGIKQVSVNITYIPKIKPKMVELWFLQLKVPLAEF